MSNNFSGIQKNAESFKPKSSGGRDAGVGKSIGGLWPGSEPIVTFEKGNNPVEPTTPYGRTDGKGEAEIGLSGEVSHPDASGGAKYVDAASVIRQSIARLTGVDASGTDKAISELSALADQLEGKSVSSFVHKSANPDLADLHKQLVHLAKILAEIARSRSGRFVTKDAGSDPRQLMKDAIASGRPAEFKGEITRSGFTTLDTGEQRNGEAKAREALGKALNNGVNIDQAIRKS